MNSYLVYLLLHGKFISKEHANERKLGKKGIPMWNVYLKWWYQNKFRHYYKRNDEWDPIFATAMRCIAFTLAFGDG